MSNDWLKPRLTLRVGVTGHRPNRLPAVAVSRVSEEASRVLDDIRRAVERAYARHSGSFSRERPSLTVVSALAEGADRILARAAIAKGEPLATVLPFSRQRYEQDFQNPASVEEFRSLLAASSSVVEFNGAGETADLHLAGAEAGYELAGLMTLRQCDLLIAVWDGGTPAGKGGTADVIARAVDSDLPCIWLGIDESAAPRILIPGVVNSGDLTGRIRTEEWTEANIDNLIATLVSPPDGKVSRSPSSDKAMAYDAGMRLRSFFDERLRRFNPWFAYPALRAAVGVRIHPRGDTDKPTDIADVRSDPARDIAGARYAFVDNQARYYGQAYRGAYVLVFLLAALSLAGAGSFLIFGGDAWIAIEFALIVAALLISLTARRRRWHERWIDYRQLAELLRHLRILALTRSSVAETRSAHVDPWCDPGTQWINWYYRATVRELGVRSAVLDRSYARNLAVLLNETELRQQIRYHLNNERDMAALDRRLDRLALALFGVAALACIPILLLRSSAPLLGTFETTLVLCLTVFGPAFGGAFYAIRMYGNFRGIARRSRLAATRLEAIRSQIDGHLRAGEEMSFPAVAYVAEQAAEIMLLEMSEWRTVFRGKPLVLPA